MKNIGIIVLILGLAKSALAITVNPASMVTADSHATALTIPYRDANGQFEMLSQTIGGTGVLTASGTATGIVMQQSQQGTGNLNIAFSSRTASVIMIMGFKPYPPEVYIRDSIGSADRWRVSQAGDMNIAQNSLHTTTITASGYMIAPYWTTAQIQAATPITAELGGQITCTNCAAGSFVVCTASGTTIQGFRLGASGTTACQ